MKNKIIEKLAGNVLLKFTALLIAFFIWLLVTNTENPVSTELYTNVPITIVNQDSIADIGKVVEAEGSGMVTVRVTERRSIRDRLKNSDFYVEADMENINEMNSVPLTVICSNPAVSWDEIQIWPSSLKLTLEDKVEQQFAITVSTVGESSGYEVGATEIAQGKNIYLAGPRSIMQIIDKVVAQVPASGLKNDVTKTVALKVYDKNGSELNENQLNSLEFKDSSGAVITNREVQVSLKMWRIANDVKMQVETTGTPAFGYRVSAINTIPATISLAGTEKALEALGNVLDLSEAISVAGVKESFSQEIDLTATVALLPELKLLNGADPIVTVEIQVEKNGDTSVSVPIGEVEFLNQPRNMSLVFTPAEKLTIPVHALSEDARELVSGDLKVRVDLSPCSEEGTHELLAEVELPEGYELASEVTLTVASAKQTTSSETISAG